MIDTKEQNRSTRIYHERLPPRGDDLPPEELAVMVEAGDNSFSIIGTLLGTRFNRVFSPGDYAVSWAWTWDSHAREVIGVDAQGVLFAGGARSSFHDFICHNYKKPGRWVKKIKP